jgi:uncharacterized RDD family membrane protein YckC
VTDRASGAAPELGPIGHTITPSLRRRLACLTYESVLIFGVLMLAAYLFSSLAQQRHALASRTLLQIYLFVVLGVYFVWFWTRGGQTLAMKTWHIRLVAANGNALSQARALARYVLSWLWFLPPLFVTWLVDTQQVWIALLSFGVWIPLYAALSFMNLERQFLHDQWSQTRLVSTASAPSLR